MCVKFVVWMDIKWQIVQSCYDVENVSWEICDYNKGLTYYWNTNNHCECECGGC
jgi:hypothetical protein